MDFTGNSPLIVLLHEADIYPLNKRDRPAAINHLDILLDILDFQTWQT